MLAPSDHASFSLAGCARHHCLASHRNRSLDSAVVQYGLAAGTAATCPDTLAKPNLSVRVGRRVRLSVNPTGGGAVQGLYRLRLCRGD
jgi:hypothetical protein